MLHQVRRMERCSSLLYTVLSPLTFHDMHGSGAQRHCPLAGMSGICGTGGRLQRSYDELWSQQDEPRNKITSIFKGKNS